MSLQIPILGDLTGLQAALRNVPGMVGNALQQANTAGSSAFGGLFSGLRSTVTNFAGFMRSSIVNAVGAVGIVQSFRSTIQQLDRVGDLAQRFGVSADSLQRLGGVAELSGASMQDVAVAMQKVSRLAAEAAIGNEAAAGSFAKVGLSVEDIRGKSPEDLFLSVSDRIAQLSSETDQAAAAFEIFGKSGGNVVIMAQMGSEEITRLGSSLVVASDESVAAAQAIDDSFKVLGQGFTSTIGKMLESLSPLINALLKLLNVSASGLGVLGATFNMAIGKGSMGELEAAVTRASEANKALFSDPFGSIVPAGRSSSVARTRTLAPDPDRPDLSLPKPQQDKGDAIRARIDDLLSSERGISPARIIADSLAQIGGGGNVATVGRSDEEQKRLLSQQLAALQKIETNTRDLDAAALR